MKYLTLLLVFCIALNLSGQSRRSGFINDVPNDKLLIEHLRENKKYLTAHPQVLKSNEILYVPVKMHLVAQTDGTGRIEYEMAVNEICHLNNQYRDAGMVFYIKDGFNEYNHTDSYEFTNFNLASARMNFVEDDNALNIFITKNAQASSNEGGFVFGVFYHSPHDFIVIRKDQIGINDIVLPHEIGHFFSLPHPYRGWENDPWNETEFGKQVTATRVFSSNSGWVNVELVNRSNCDNAGDLICDTDVDYFFSFLWDNDCPPFSINITDLNGDTIIPPMNNFMSNFFGCNDYQFSEDQIALMRADYASSRRSYIRDSYIPDTTIISEELDIITPGFNETVDKFDNVDVAWNKVENASSYVVEIKGAGQEINFITSDTSLNLTTLTPNSVYTLSILPFNETGGCAEKEGSIFRTTDSSTSVEDPEYTTDIAIFPNPLDEGNNLQFEFTSSLRTNAYIRIFDYSGKNMLQRKVPIESGKNKYEFSMQGTATGIYTLILQSDNGNILRRFVVL